MTNSKKRTVGSGITQREKDPFLTFGSENNEKIRASFRERSQTIDRPWGAQRKIIRAARVKLDEILEEAPKIEDADTSEKLDAYNEFFKERDSIGWYVNEISLNAILVETAVESGRPWEAVELAMQIGDLFAEMRFKGLWESQAVFGKDLRKKYQEGGYNGRKHPPELRHQLVLEEIKMGVNKSKAFRNVAEKIGVSWQVVKLDFYAQEKLVSC